MTRIISSWHHDYHTESAGTIITEIIPGADGYIARLNNLVYRVAGTAHVLTMLRVIGSTVTTAAAAASQADLVVSSASPGKNSSGVAEALASSDYLSWKDANGVWKFDLVSSVSSLTVTMANSLPTAVDSGATIYAFYEVGRADHHVFTPAVSTTMAFNATEAGLMQGGIPAQLDRHNLRNGQGDPLLFHSTNVTAAGFLEQMSGTYVQE